MNKKPSGVSKYTPRERMEIALAAQVDPHTVARMLRGETVRPSLRARIESAIRLREATS